MSTKSLAKSVIEGGRCGHYKADVYKRARQERAQVREYLRIVRRDPEVFEEHVEPVRQPEYPCFADKLNPIYRFLESRAGRRWSDVRAELFARFDTRTTPGRHVLFDHLLKDVSENSDPASPARRFARFFVDRDGLLAKDPAWYRRQMRSERSERCNRAVVAAWMGERKIGRSGYGFTWFEPVERGVRCVYEHGFIYAETNALGDVIRDPRPPIAYSTRVIPQPPVVRRAKVAFRQARRLDAREEAYFLTLPPAVREEILALAPANV